MAAWQRVRAAIAASEQRHGRAAGSVRLLAVSKRQQVAAMAALAGAGQEAFGENYLQEAEPKIAALAAHYRLQWHFIGAVQSNKTAAIARAFDWVHTVDRVKIARRLAHQRPAGAGPLNVCIEVNISGEASKAGVEPAAVSSLADGIAELASLRLRGLMCLPAPGEDIGRQRRAFRELAAIAAAERARGHALDTLSMGTSADMDAAIAEGSTLVRIGTAVFGSRERLP